MAITEEPVSKAPVFSEIGSTGLRRWDGDYSFLDEEFLPDLRGTAAINVYKEMASNDPTVGAFLFAIDMLMRQATWRVEPYDDTPTHQERAELVESCLGDMVDSWDTHVSEILSMLVYGWSWHEINYKVRKGWQRNPRKSSQYDDGKIGWSQIPIRAQETLNGWVWNGQQLVGMRQLAAPDYDDVVIPHEKSLLFRTRTYKGSPEGRSVLRNAYRPWWFKKRIEEIEGIGVERDLAGLPIVYVDPAILAADASAADKATLVAMRNLVRNVRRDKQEGIVFPRLYDADGNLVYEFELLSTGGARQFNTEDVVQRYDQRIAMTVLADFILLGSTGQGSWALSSDKTNLFSVAIGAWMQTIADPFNRYAIPRLMALNSWPEHESPELVPGDIETPPLADLADYISKLSASGFPLFPNEDLEDHLMEVASFPEISDEVRRQMEEQREMDAAMAQETAQAQLEATRAAAEAPAGARSGAASSGATRTAGGRQASPQGRSGGSRGNLGTKGSS